MPAPRERSPSSSRTSARRRSSSGLQARCSEEVGPALERPPDRRAEPPAAHRAVVARDQDVGHAAAPRRRPGGCTAGTRGGPGRTTRPRARRPRSRPGGGAGPRRPRRAPPARRRSARSRRSRARGRRATGSARRRPRSAGRGRRGGSRPRGRSARAWRKGSPAGSSRITERVGAAQRRQGARHGLRAEDHPGPAAVGRVVDAPVAAEAPGAQVVDPNGGEPLLLDAAGDARRERARDHLREEGDDVDLEGHGSALGGRVGRGRRAPTVGRRRSRAGGRRRARAAAAASRRRPPPARRGERPQGGGAWPGGDAADAAAPAAGPGRAAAGRAPPGRRRSRRAAARGSGRTAGRSAGRSRRAARRRPRARRRRRPGRRRAPCRAAPPSRSRTATPIISCQK